MSNVYKFVSLHGINSGNYFVRLIVTEKLKTCFPLIGYFTESFQCSLCLQYQPLTWCFMFLLMTGHSYPGLSS